MSGRYNDRYNERRPNLSFRVSPELRDRLLELQDGSDKTLGEIAESVLADGFPSSNKNHSSNPNNAYPNGDKNGVAEGKQPNDNLYENGFNDGFKNGSNHAKKDIKNRINGNSQKTNDKINDLVKQHIENSRETCPHCSEKFIYEGFPLCPHCGAEVSSDNNNSPTINHPLGIGDSGIRIPIISDLFDSLGIGGEDSTVEDSGREGKGLTFVGGNKPTSYSKKEEDTYGCYNCDHIQGSPFAYCSKCGAKNCFEDKNMSKKEGPEAKEEDTYGCYNCDHVEKFPFKKCPSCGSNNSWD